MEKKDIDWGNLSFAYIKTDKRFVSNLIFYQIFNFSNLNYNLLSIGMHIVCIKYC